MSTPITEITGATVVDPLTGKLTPNQRILIDGDRIRAVLDPDDEGYDAPSEGQVLDAGGRILAPGFIDAHVHLLGYEANLGAPAHESPAYVTARAVELMHAILRRGFTTVRDMGGTDHGLVRAVDEGLLEGPRIFHCGPALSQTGGHGDFRTAGEHCIHSISTVVPTVGLVCDGVPAIRTAIRNEIRRGARHIKLMLGGGIASPTDRIDSQQFSVEEITAAVEEADNADIYVSGHAYTPKAMKRALELGVRCIEHGTLLDDETAALFAEREAFLVPTLGTGAILASPEGAKYGVSEETRQKAAQIREAGVEMLLVAQRNGVQIAFGTDFIGSMQELQSTEFAIRAEVLSGIEILQSVTVTAAKLLRQEHELGQIAAGYLADFVVLNVNPIDDIAQLSDPERSVEAVISRGQLIEA